jgi:hypothetical protein
MADIPKAREILTEALEYSMDDEVRQRIEAAMQEMYRDFIGRKAKPTSRKMTVELAGQIKSYAARNPKAGYKEIANAFSVNQGRVSEALAGKYDERF